MHLKNNAAFDLLLISQCTRQNGIKSQVLNEFLIFYMT